MKFLGLIILWCLQKNGVSSKLNFDKINNNPKKYTNTNTNPNLLPINRHNDLLMKKCSTIKFSGYDERYLDDEIIKTDPSNIFRHIENKIKLEILENKSVSIFDKLELVKDNHIKPSNIHAGGLMDDFNFNFEYDKDI
jgi:hypothetical protein